MGIDPTTLLLLNPCSAQLSWQNKTDITHPCYLLCQERSSMTKCKKGNCPVIQKTLAFSHLKRHLIKSVYSIMLLLSLKRQKGQIVELHINVLTVCSGTERKKLSSK